VLKKFDTGYLRIWLNTQTQQIALSKWTNSMDSGSIPGNSAGEFLGFKMNLCFLGFDFLKRPKFLIFHFIIHTFLRSIILYAQWAYHSGNWQSDVKFIQPFTKWTWPAIKDAHFGPPLDPGSCNSGKGNSAF
jgi:hypothetical protein